MSDFLSNLLIRSFAQAPGIQPRLPSPFEPIPAAVRAAAPDAGEAPDRGDPVMMPGHASESAAGIVDRECPATPRTTSSAAMPPVNVGIARKLPSARQTEMAEPPLAASPSLPSLPPAGGTPMTNEASSQPLASLPRETPAEPAVPPLRVEDAEPVHPPPEAAARDTSYGRRPAPEPRHNAPRMDSLSIDAPAINNGTTPSLATAAPLDAGTSRTPITSQRRAYDAQKSSASLRPYVPHAVDVRTRHMAVMPPAPTSADAGPPAVRITIGRVEVRATAAPAPPVSQSPRPQASRRDPMLSLDDYLRRPKGGHR
jgi:hypothetical protein